MRILTSREMQAADEAAITEIGIGSRALMESAGRECAAVILNSYEKQARRGVVVAVGSGNNGGDGFVIARTLKAAGLSAVVVSCCPAEKLKVDPKANLESWKRLGGALHQFSDEETDLAAELLSGAGLIVDAVFGTGFSGEPRGA
ncbi:MAG: NAD(P)H-hydrate epimerase, partial [Bdellovibrionales bacterium]|nr:NAD(P)H-hydrate epimerase [Bdellovibrionales bacterium]